jgi:hypothetical protein
MQQARVNAISGQNDPGSDVKPSQEPTSDYGSATSIGTARMVGTAAWLCDAVIPEVPVRQQVLSLPHRVRTLCAYDASACRLVRNVLVRAVSGSYERMARIARAQSQSGRLPA